MNWHTIVQLSFYGHILFRVIREKVNRNFYGGAIGYIDFNGNFNHAIIIRSFFSKNNILNYQAGAGIVIDSIPEKELEEVKNKLGALDKALEEAEKIKWKRFF